MDKNYFLNNLEYSLINENKDKEDTVSIKKSLRNGLCLLLRVKLKDEDEALYARVTKSMVENFDISEAELFDIARANMNDKEVYIMRISQLLAKKTGIPEEILGKTEDILIVTNEKNTNGSALILNSGVKEKLEDRLGKFVLFPASIHEFIAIPAKTGNIEKMREIVKSVNDEQLKERDYLSDDVFTLDDFGNLVVL